MAKRKKTGQHRIIPEPLRQGLRQGGVLVRGAVLAVLGLATVLALASFDAADPSFNRATPAPPANWLHLPGAYGADLLLQTLGLAAILIGLALLAWGGQILFRPEHRLSRPWLRLCLLPLAVLLGAVALAGVPAPHAWPFSAGLGGVTGALGISRAAEIVNIWWGLDQARPLVAIAAGMFTASFGGIIRDTFCAAPARILHSHQDAYASLTMMGACTYVALSAAQASVALRIAIPIVLVVAARKAAWTRGWRLPGYRP